MESTQKPSSADPIRVMIVDDSAVIRGFLTRFIEQDSGLKVVASAANGQIALDMQARQQLDVIVLDIEMPVMDGLTALPKLIATDPNVQVVMASTLTKENAAVTLRCLQMGAAECLAKPTSSELSGSTLFQEGLVHKVRSLGEVARKRRGQGFAEKSTAKAATPAAVEPKKFTLRSEITRQVPDVLAVGSSTGGPQALMQFFGDLKTPLRQPVLVTQHMPPTFTAILADNITKQTGLPCSEAKDGDVVEGGKIYVAPGGYHMTVKSAGAGKNIIALNQEPPENFCRPAVDPMLRSLVQVYGRKILTVILTGMGADGLKGSQAVVEAGGSVLAQDEATSVVWGMPGAVAMAGICTQVLPIKSMAQAVRGYTDMLGARP